MSLSCPFFKYIVRSVIHFFKSKLFCFGKINFITSLANTISEINLDVLFGFLYYAIEHEGLMYKYIVLLLHLSL